MIRTYTKVEVVQMLVSNMNEVMQLIDKSKIFKINYNNETVETFKSGFFGKTIITTNTFDYVIKEAGGKI